MTDSATQNGAQFSSTWMGFIGGFIAIAVTLVVAAQTILPYYMQIPEANAGTIGQQQTMFQTVFVMIASFFFGASVGSRLKDNVASKQADTNAALTAALTPQGTTTTTTVTTPHPSTQAPPVVATVTTPSTTVPLHAGETAAVKADPPK